MTLITNLDTISARKVLIDAGRRVHHASVASWLRPADTDVYTAGDAISTLASGAIQFPDCAIRDGGSGLITHATLAMAEQQGTAPQMELFLFDAEPTNFADNAAMSLVNADIERWMHKLLFTAANSADFGSGAAGQTFYIAALEFPKPFKCGDTTKSLFGLLRTAAFTPASASKFFIRLHLEYD